LSLLTNLHGQKGDRYLNKCRADPSGSERHKKSKRQKWERKKLQLSQETFKWLFYSDSEVQRRHFCGTCKRTEKRKTCCDGDLRNDENRPSLTSSAVAEERQYAPSSKNTIHGMADAITGGNDIGLCALWPANIPEKMWEYWLKYEKDSFWSCGEKSFYNMMFHNTATTKTCHGNVPCRAGPMQSAGPNANVGTGPFWALFVWCHRAQSTVV